MELPQPGYTIREAELLLNLPYKALYRLIKEGQIPGYYDRTGKMRVSQSAVYEYMRRRAMAR
jgi:excisionase family DNA binding protein